METSFPLLIDAKPGVSVQLNADGSWSGDGRAFLDALNSNPSMYSANNAVIVWLVANAIRNSMPIDAALYDSGNTDP